MSEFIKDDIPQELIDSFFEKTSENSDIDSEIIDIMKYYKDTNDLLLSPDIDNKISIILLKLNYFLDNCFFNKKSRKKEFNSLLNDRDSNTTADINYFLEENNNKILSNKVWQALLETGILDWSLGNIDNSNIKDRIELITTLGYYSLQNCLRIGIDSGLFIQNIVKLFPKIKDKVIKDFSNDFSLSGGLALTELTSGTDLLADFNTTYVKNEDGTYTITGIKHLQGLSGEASHWIVLAKEKDGRKIGLFMIDTRNAGEDVDMVEEYDMRGLKGIKYGVNKINAIVSSDCVFECFEKDRTGLKTFQSMLFDSRLQFPAMAGGYLDRLYDESYFMSSLRKIGSGKTKYMIDNENVQDKLFYIKTYSKVIKLINNYLIEKKVDLFSDNRDKEELSIICKTVSTEYMLNSGYKARDLQGGFGFKEKNIISNLVDDAWPFSRFEGVNEMLYSRLGDIFNLNNLTLDTVEILIKNNISLIEIEDSPLTKENKGKLFSRIELINMLIQTNTYDLDILKLLIEEIRQILNTCKEDITF